MSSVVELSRALAESLAESETVTAREPLQLEPGIYRDLPMADYLALPYLSASRLEKLRRSPLQYRHSLTEPQKQSAVLERGTALHLAVLEAGMFDAHYVVLGQCEGTKKDRDRCSNSASIIRNGRQYCGTHDPERGQPMTDDCEIIPEKDHAAVLGMREAILSHPRARSLFEGKGDFELTILWRDDETGTMCKARPDRLIERAGMHVALKTTRDAAPWAFPRDAEGRGYFRSLSFYRRGLRAVGWPYISTSVLAVESAAPHDLVCYLPDEVQDIDSADLEVTRLLRMLATCIETNTWDGYGRDFLPLSRPAWTRNGDQS